MSQPERFIAILLTTCLLLAGCKMTRQQTGPLGTISGGEQGRGVGARHVATFRGRIGRSMDERDRRKAVAVLEAEPTGQSSGWVNPQSGNRYQVTPTHTYYRHTDAAGREQPCRDYMIKAWIKGKKETLFGTACRQAQGTWQPLARPHAQRLLPAPAGPD